MVFDFACNGHLHISFAQKKYGFYIFMEILQSLEFSFGEWAGQGGLSSRLSRS